MMPTSNIRAEAKIIKASGSIATVIGETLLLKRSGQHLIALCPFHQERTPSFYIYLDHYHCFGCGAHGNLLDWLVATRRMTFRDAVRHLATDGRPASEPLPPAKPAPSSPNATADVFLRCWNEATDPCGSLVESYLRNRGDLIVPDGAPIRFHPHCQRGSRKLAGGAEYWPAMVALMTDPISGQPTGLHRTYLHPDGSGKAPTTIRGGVVLKPKMILGGWGVVRLAPDQDVGRALGITEGIENALTIMQIVGWGPTWAAGTQGGLRDFPLLPWIEALSIFADADDSGVGVSAAHTCGGRWEAAGTGPRIHFIRPARGATDRGSRVSMRRVCAGA